MIKAGTMVCFAQAHKVEDPYYYIAHERLVLATAKNSLGDYTIYDRDGKATVELVEKPKTLNGLLLKAHIKVTFADGKIRNFIIDNENRICPQCYDSEKMIHYLPANMGYEDTYIIGVIGRPDVGKSAWIDSVSRELTLCEDSQMYLANRATKGVVKYEATQINSRKKLVREILLTNKRGKTCGELLINDTPGEFLTLKAEDRGPDYDYFKRYIDLCDAIVYVLENGDENNENLNWMTFLPEDMPVAIIMSKLDKIEAATKGNGGVYVHESVPLLTSTYFKNRKNMKATSVSRMIENQVVDRFVLRQLCPSLSMISRKKRNVAYFAVSAGVPFKEDETELDLKYGVNVMAPVIFIKNYLGI